MHVERRGALVVSARCHPRRTPPDGTPGGVATACERLGGERIEDEALWRNLRDHRLPFFDGPAPLWRVSVPAASAPLDLDGEVLLDWGGAQRWLRTDADSTRVRTAASAAGGHALAFRNTDRAGEIYHPLEPGIARLHERLKAAFDPAGILNPGRMYAGC